MSITAIMNREPAQVAPRDTLERALELLAERGLRHLPVVEHGQVVGLLSQRALLETPDGAARHGPGASGSTELVRDLMSVPVETIGPGDGLAEACALMVERKLGCLPVVEAGRLLGVLSEQDVLAAYSRLCSDDGALPAFDPPVGDVMARQVVTVDTGAGAAEALALMHAERVRHLPVVHEGWFVGLLSDRDLRRCAGAGRLQSSKVQDVMVADMATVTPADRLSLAARVMGRLRIGSAPVVESGRLVGIVTASDVLAWCARPEWPAALTWLAAEPSA